MSTEPSIYESLPSKRRAFVDRYIQDENATESAKVAGYRSPSVEGSRLLKNAKVRAAIVERKKKVGEVGEKRLRTVHEYFLQLETIAFNGEHGSPQVSALRELIKVRDEDSPKEKERSEERRARIAYIKAKTAEVAGGTDELGDVLIKWEDAKE